ncbi:glycoside hydrolase [Methylonatrum kenyense]|uniref:sialidase family protein n=1 Tax=Methylonatrum kenyense TaxID=455253 RepID=UPI0020C02737|nr:sialidase family protein [Methylonatrum kenyense]MCK8515169.1 glycoside hydrolase [Methylonatrum kenyense]
MGLVTRLLLLLALALAGCQQTAEPPEPDLHHLAETDHPVVSLAVTADRDRLHVAWAEEQADGAYFARHSHSEDGGGSWSDPVTIDTDQRAPSRVHRSNDLRIAAHGDHLLVVWQTRGDGFADSGPMVMAESEDAGQNWMATPPPANEEDSQAHGFFGLHADAEGTWHLAWLDMRNGAQGLRYAQRPPDLQDWNLTHTLDPATCQCCWNTVASADDRLWVLYRALDPRDMALARSEDGGGSWQLDGVVGGFDWDVDACPHVGGDLALDNGTDPRLHALVWTGEEQAAGVHYLHAPADNTTSWSSPRRLGGTEAGNPALVSTDAGSLLAAWDEHNRIHVATNNNGDWLEATVSSEDRRASHPLLTTTRHGTQVFWTERDADGQRRWAMARLPAERTREAE